MWAEGVLAGVERDEKIITIQPGGRIRSVLVMDAQGAAEAAYDTVSSLMTLTGWIK